MPSTGLLTTSELAARLKVTAKAVRKWVKAGCPVARRDGSGHGRPAFRFDLKAVRCWLVESGNVNRAMLSAPGAITPPQRPGTGNVQINGTTGSAFTDALMRARQSEEESFTLWVTTLEKDPMAAAAYHARYLAAADCLTKMEKAKDEILIGEKTSIRTEDAYEATAAMLKSVRIDLEAIPNAIAPRLAGLSVPETAAVLREAIQDCLRHIYAKGEK